MPNWWIRADLNAWSEMTQTSSGNGWRVEVTTGNSSVENAPLVHLRPFRLQDEDEPSRTEKARWRSRDDLREQRQRARCSGREARRERL